MDDDTRKRARAAGALHAAARDVRSVLVPSTRPLSRLVRVAAAAAGAGALVVVAACGTGAGHEAVGASLGTTMLSSTATLSLQPSTAEPSTARPATTPAWSQTGPPKSPSPTPSLPPKPRRPVPPPPAPLHYRFPAAGCHVSYGSSHHDYPATDIFAPRGCHFVAVVRGTVDEVSYRDTWHSTTNSGAARGGLSVSIVGADGVRYYGSHLERIAAGIAPGVHVRAGQLLGYVGNTGDARGIATHIHFGISWPTSAGKWWIRRGELSPYRYLNAWRAGTELSPRRAVAATRRALGGDPRCRVDC